MLTLAELQNLNSKELQAELLKARRELLKITLLVKTRQDKKSHLIRGYKRYIAQILTILNRLPKVS